MEFIDNIITFVQGLDRKQFYQYLTLLLLTTFIITGLLCFFSYKKTSSLVREIEKVYDIHNNEVAMILSEAALVKKQRDEVNAILSEDEQFKIGGYFNKVLTTLSLSENKTEETTSQIDLDDQYRQSILNAQFTNMSMKQLCELLNEIERKERISTKSLEIKRSTQTPKTIDVNLTIATLQPKSIIQE